MRSAVTSRSNWAKLRRTFSVSRPILVAVLKDWVTETKDAVGRCLIEDRKANAALLSHAVTVRVCPACRFQQISGSFEILFEADVIGGRCIRRRRGNDIARRFTRRTVENF